MIIDGFTLFGSWPGLPSDHPVDQLMSGLVRFKVDRACCLASKGIFFDAMAGNEATWAASQQDPRLIPIGTADPRSNGLEQVDHCKQRGFKMMALFPVSQGWSFDSITANVVLRRIADMGVPVLIETSRDGDVTRVMHAAQGLGIPIILLDVSVPIMAEAIAILRSMPNSRSPYMDALRAPITEALNILKGGPDIYLATRLLCGGDTLEYLVQTVGADRLIFTSRYPISCFSASFLTAKFADITEEDRVGIMGGNLARLLGK